MKTIRHLDMGDMADIIATAFGVGEDAVSIEIVPISVGYGMAEHTEYTARCTVEIDEAKKR